MFNVRLINFKNKKVSEKELSWNWSRNIGFTVHHLYHLVCHGAFTVVWFGNDLLNANHNVQRPANGKRRQSEVIWPSLFKYHAFSLPPPPPKRCLMLRLINNYSTSARWIWVGYNYLISNKREWNNYFLKNAAVITRIGKFLSLVCPLKYHVTLILAQFMTDWTLTLTSQLR